MRTMLMKAKIESNMESLFADIEELIFNSKRIPKTLWKETKKQLKNSMELYMDNCAIWDSLSKSELIKETKFNRSISTMRNQAAQIRDLLRCKSHSSKTDIHIEETFNAIHKTINQLKDEYALYRELKKGSEKNQKTWRRDEVFDPVFTNHIFHLLRYFTDTDLAADEATALLVTHIEPNGSPVSPETIRKRILAFKKRPNKKRSQPPIYVSENTFKLLRNFVKDQ